VSFIITIIIIIIGIGGDGATTSVLPLITAREMDH
jgi:hypothetical protein